MGQKDKAVAACQRSLALNDDQPWIKQQIVLFLWELNGASITVGQIDDMKTRGKESDDANTVDANAVSPEGLNLKE